MMNSVNRIGFWSGLAAFAAIVAFGIVQALQLLHILTYPLDEFLIYGTSLCIVIPYLIAMLALHYVSSGIKKFWSHASLIFTSIYAVFVTANYVVQLTTVIPMTLKGEAGKINVLIQTPHSLFWDFDAIGYLFMGLATLFAVPVFEKNGFEGWVRGFFLANGLVNPLIAVVYFYPAFSEELLLLGIPWIITAPMCMLLLALLFKRKYKNGIIGIEE